MGNFDQPPLCHRYNSPLNKDHNGKANNNLHQAILAGNVSEAKILIQEYQHNPAFINHRVWGNTPLLLSLKLGLFDVAEELIALQNCDIDIYDSLGMRPIH